MSASREEQQTRRLGFTRSEADSAAWCEKEKIVPRGKGFRGGLP